MKLHSLVIWETNIEQPYDNNNTQNKQSKKNFVNIYENPAAIISMVKYNT